MEIIKKAARHLVPLNLQERYRVAKVREKFDQYRFSESEDNLLKAFDRESAIFIHIPKTAGISIRESLFQTHGFGKHIKAITYKYYLGDKTFHSYFKFAFVRNPYARTLSAYYFLEKGGISAPDKEWSEKVLSKYPTFAQFILNGLEKPEILQWVHFIPQYKWICDHKNRNLMDFVGSVENLQEDYEYVRQKFGTGKLLAHKNQGPSIRDTYRDHYSKAMKEKVARVYKADLGLFHYSF